MLTGDRRALSAEPRTTRKQDYIYSMTGEQEKLQNNLTTLLTGQRERIRIKQTEAFKKGDRDEEASVQEELMTGSLAYALRQDCFTEAMTCYFCTHAVDTIH